MLLQVAGFFVNVLTLLAVAFAAWVYYRQLQEMKNNLKAQNMAALIAYLQAPEVRAARAFVLGRLKRKNAQEAAWNDEDKEEAATALAAYGTAGVLIRLERVDPEPILENWGPSIIATYEIAESLIEERRAELGSSYWQSLTWLYEQTKRRANGLA
jgi:hypothetical protein